MKMGCVWLIAAIEAIGSQLEFPKHEIAGENLEEFQ